jgi:hypothetical protein
MRVKLSLLAVAAVSAATSAVMLSAPSASAAQECPPGTILRHMTVAGHQVNYCFPGVQCDPGPCDPTAAPGQD